MRRINASSAAMLLSALALFVALGGTTWASGLISGGQIKKGSITSSRIGRGQVKNVNLASGSVHTGNLANGVVTTPKLANNAVTTSKIANNAVTSAKVADGSLTASDLAPNTFVQGRGNLVFNRIQLSSGQSGQLLGLGLGHIDGTCAAGGKPQLSYVAEVAPVNLIAWATTFPSTVDVHTTNGIGVGGTYIEPNTGGLPQAVTFQTAENSGGANHVATAWTTGQDILGTSCIFTGQGVTSG